MADPLILSLEESHDPRLVGGKAAGLAKLLAAGFAVPRGICVTTTLYRRCMEAAGLDVTELWKKALGSSDTQRARHRARIQGLLLEQPWPAGFRTELDGWLTSLTDRPSIRWAVRSSATNEDATETSAAGLYRTALGQLPQEVLRAIHDCWMSLWDEQVFRYLLRFGTEQACPAMAVVIQPMLDANIAGVAYSIHPVTGRTTQVVISSVPGLASSLVDGDVTPDQYVVEVGESLRPMLVRRRLLAEKPWKMVMTAEGVQPEQIPALERQGSSLSDEQLFELARLAKQIEAAFRCPVDVEWVWNNERLWIVQARPTTGVKPSHGLTNDDCAWTRANFKETMPELPSPLGLSFLARFMEAYIVAPYRRFGCTIPEGLSSVRLLHGRPYLNVTLFYSLVVQLHGDPAYVTEQMGGEPLTFTPAVRPLGPLALARAGLGMVWEWRRVTTQAPENFAAMKQMAETYRPDRIEHLSAQELSIALDNLGRWLDGHEITFGIAGGVAQCLQAMGKCLPEWLGSDWRALLNASVQGQKNVISAQQIVRLAELVAVVQREPSVQRRFQTETWTVGGLREAFRGTEFLRLFEQYLADYGHRAVGESDIMSPRIADQPEVIVALLQQQVRSGETASPEEMLSRQVRRREEALAEIKRRFGRWCHRWIVFRWWYRRLVRFCALREENRHHLMYYSAAARHLLLRLGERMVEQGTLTLREDVFYLTLDEQTALVVGPTRDWKGLVRNRREERLRNEAMQVPDTVRDWQEAADQGNLPGDLGRDGVLRGIAVSAGLVSGPVRVVRSTADWKRVQVGDILVVPVIDPGMVPLFGMVAGVVAEMGGTLSHGAIIAREYGLPAMVNVPYATSLLYENEQIQMDSASGTIRRSVT
ncbi:MAG: Phosphoenolpyruvate synthase [Nitrospira sp.]|jgi:pyruvate,water dikinase|nr:MAG: Phosphoenolpyruvate synthase [Nitrospira sp.]